MSEYARHLVRLKQSADALCCFAAPTLYFAFEFTGNLVTKDGSARDQCRCQLGIARISQSLSCRGRLDIADAQLAAVQLALALLESKQTNARCIRTRGRRVIDPVTGFVFHDGVKGGAALGQAPLAVIDTVETGSWRCHDLWGNKRAASGNSQACPHQGCYHRPPCAKPPHQNESPLNIIAQLNRESSWPRYGANSQPGRGRYHKRGFGNRLDSV